MTDPLDALRAPVEPVDPDPEFATRLRERLRRAVLHPSGGDMTETIDQAESTGFGWPPPLTPYIVVSDARRALDWYVAVFGATRRGELYENADGTIGHAEVAIGDGVLMFAEASDLYPDVPVGPPGAAPATHSHSLNLQVDDVDATASRAAERGARVERPPQETPYGRTAVIIDPFGHRWILLTPPAGATQHVPGDISRVTMVVADDEAAKRFYGAVLGWEFEPRSVPGAWGPVGKAGREFGIWGDPSQRPEVQLCYTVRDIAAATQRVRDAGGQAGDIERRPWGLMADCVDNQGAHFQLWQPA